jgi:hypothetical protein
MMAGLHQPDRATAAGVKLRCKIPQHPVRVLVPFVDQGREVALGIEHGAIFRELSNRA